MKSHSFSKLSRVRGHFESQAPNIYHFNNEPVLTKGLTQNVKTLQRLYGTKLLFTFHD